jgi:hypothetical protein
MFRLQILVERKFNGRSDNPVSMFDESHDRTWQMLQDALHHFQSGLELLDRAGAPGQIGAHIDLAIHQLCSAMSTPSSPASKEKAEGVPASS